MIIFALAVNERRVTVMKFLYRCFFAMFQVTVWLSKLLCFAHTRTVVSDGKIRSINTTLSFTNITQINVASITSYFDAR